MRARQKSSHPTTVFFFFFLLFFYFFLQLLHLKSKSLPDHSGVLKWFSKYCPVCSYLCWRHFNSSSKELFEGCIRWHLHKAQTCISLFRLNGRCFITAIKRFALTHSLTHNLSPPIIHPQVIDLLFTGIARHTQVRGLKILASRSNAPQ